MNQNLLPQARTNNLVTQEMPDEILVYDLKNHKAHCLNQTAAAVWKHCDGKTSVTEMIALIKQNTHQTVDEASVWYAIEHLGKANLLKNPVHTPVGVPRLGRREALRRLGLGSAIAVPVVMSILAPTVLAGCTFPDSQAIGSTCCTDAQCGTFAVGGTPRTLTCCTAGAVGHCYLPNGTPCSGAGDCCSGTCTGGVCV